LLGWFNYKKHAFHAYNFNSLASSYCRVFGGGFPELAITRTSPLGLRSVVATPRAPIKASLPVFIRLNCAAIILYPLARTTTSTTQVSSLAPHLFFFHRTFHAEGHYFDVWYGLLKRRYASCHHSHVADGFSAFLTFDWFNITHLLTIAQASTILDNSSKSLSTNPASFCTLPVQTALEASLNTN
jgi:hypothetical protein